TLVERDTRYIKTIKMDAEALKQWVISLLARIFKNQKNPVVVLLEDLHHAGSESLHVLHYLSLLVEDMPVMLVGSYNDDETPDLNLSLSGMSIMKLRRLSPAAIADLSAAMLGDAGRSEEVLDLLQRETDGNVYFMIEVIRALAEGVGNLADIGRMTLPQRVFAQGMKSIIERRLSRINADGITLLQYAATMGTQLNIALLQQILPHLDIQRLLMHCADASVLEVQEETWFFAHNRLREGVLEDVSATARYQLHMDVAAAIEAYYGESPAYLHTLAYHYHEAEDEAKEEYFVSKAGTQSLQRGAYHEAITCFKRAQELINRLRLDARTTAYRQLKITIQIASAYTGIGAYDDARNWYQQGLTQAMTLHDTSQTALIHSYLGEVSLVLGENDIAKHQYEMSLQLYERARDDSGIARALNGLGNVAYEEGDSANATSFYQRSMNLSRELGESRGMAGAVRQTQRLKTLDTRPFTYEETKDLYSAALELYEKQQNSNGIADALYNLGLAAYEVEAYSEATAYLERSIPHLEQTEKTAYLAQVYNRLGRIATRQKKYTSAKIYFENAFHNLRYTPIETLPTLLNLARLSIAQAEFESALHVLAFLLHYEESPEAIEDDA
ncbi:MAG: tetratricopeptide repeat protein, partial [Aggregatilineales bacterium]